jgi:hypothetical protein
MKCLIQYFTVSLEKLTVRQLVKGVLTFVEPEGSSPHYQKPNILCYPGLLLHPFHRFTSRFSKIYFDVILSSAGISPTWSLPLIFFFLNGSAVQCRLSPP